MDLIDKRFIREAKYQREIEKGVSQCLTCERKCRIPNGQLGHCQTRYNLDGQINTIVYGCNAGMSNDPIEKKPLYHFYPGTRALTIGAFGCNFDCFWCQNHHMSHPNKQILEIMKNYDKYISPKQFIDLALESRCQGTSISFNEPTLSFEFSLEVFKLAKQNSLYNTYVTNGYMTETVLRDLIENGLDAMNIDLKGDSKIVQNYCGADVENVWRNAKLATELGVHVEITTLLIPKLNTESFQIEKIAKRILNDLGVDTPYHISKFSPRFKALEYGYLSPTSEKYMLNAYNIAKSIGLNYVYLGNLSNSDYENTYCPNCSELVIKRDGYSIEDIKLDDKGNCDHCGIPIAIK